ncbi:MAG: hypothetical protein ACR2I2_12375 [Bryobacteraceae bacterium]
MSRLPFIAVVSIAAAARQNPEGPAANNLPAARIAGEIPGDRIGNPEKQGDWPAIAYAKDGALYAIWIEWNDKDADRVLARRRDPQGKWGPEIAVEDAAACTFRVRLDCEFTRTAASRNPPPMFRVSLRGACNATPSSPIWRPIRAGPCGWYSDIAHCRNRMRSIISMRRT